MTAEEFAAARTLIREIHESLLWNPRVIGLPRLRRFVGDSVLMTAADGSTGLGCSAGVGGGMSRCRSPGRSGSYVGQVAPGVEGAGSPLLLRRRRAGASYGGHPPGRGTAPDPTRRESAAVVVFISADYAGRDWTTGWNAALRSAEAVAEAGALTCYPPGLMTAKLPGLLPDVVTVDLRHYSPEQFAELGCGQARRSCCQPIANIG